MALLVLSSKRLQRSNVYMCVHVCVYVCVHVCVHVCGQVSCMVYVATGAKCLCVCVCVCVHVHVGMLHIVCLFTCYRIAETLVFQTVSEILLMAWYVHAKHIRTPHGRFYAACWHHSLGKGPKPIL